MVQVSVTASINVAGGPTVPLGTMFDPESYTYASVDLDADVELDVVLLPDAGRVILLALATGNRGTAPAEPTTVTVIPKHSSTEGGALTVTGALLIANPGVLECLVEAGPRTLKVKNAGQDPATVDVLACLDLS